MKKVQFKEVGQYNDRLLRAQTAVVCLLLLLVLSLVVATFKSIAFLIFVSGVVAALIFLLR